MKKFFNFKNSIDKYKLNIRKLYKLSFLFVLGQVVLGTILLIDNRGNINSLARRYKIREIISNSSFDTFYPRDYLEYFGDIFYSLISSNKIKRMELSVNFKDLIGLECSREMKDNCSKDGWIRGPKLVNQNRTYRVKLKSKGDRKIHKLNIKNMSLKVDIRGRDRLFGMEEFSLQMPIIRNYTIEPLVANLLRNEDILAPRNIYTRLFMNGEYLGIRHLEEGFSRELIENAKRRYGPIYSLNEELEDTFINNNFDLHDQKYWQANNTNLHLNGLSILKEVRDNPQFINKYFDIKKWAKFFAMLDVYEMYHGTLPKSMRFYLNPVTGLFEPVFYDGHYGEGLFDNYLLSDVINHNENPLDCRYTCTEIDFYKLFFGNNTKINKTFLEYYLDDLKYFSSESFIKNNFQNEWNNLRSIRGSIYREFHKKDHNQYKGFLPHIAPKGPILARAKNIRKKIIYSENKIPDHSFNFNKNELKITNTTSQVPQIYNTYCGENYNNKLYLIKNIPVKVNIKNIDKKCTFKNFKFSINKGVNKKLLSNTMVSNLLFEDTLEREKIIKKKDSKDNILVLGKGLTEINKDLKLVNKKIILEKDSKICIKNNALIQIKNSDLTISDNSDTPIIINGCSGNSGSILIESSNIIFNNILISNLKNPKIELRELYGGVNLINSNLKGKKLTINNSLSEDAINFIDSDVNLESLTFNNINSDALDSDFSILNIGNIYCKKIGNDCIDLSFSKGNINQIKANSVLDKVISLGEKSNLYIDNIFIKMSEIGLVAKDDSNLIVNRYNFEDVKIPIASYIKKNEYGRPKTIIKKLDTSLYKESSNFISNDSEVVIEGKYFLGNKSSSQISNLLYGNLYGTKTKR